MWHVAVVALAAGRIRRVVRVRRQVTTNFFVTLKAGMVTGHALFELIDGIGIVHRMAAQAGHGALLKTWRFQHAVVFASRYAHHAIAPKVRIEKGGGRLLMPRLRYLRGMPSHHPRIFKLVAGPIKIAAFAPRVSIQFSRNAVALPTDLR